MDDYKKKYKDALAKADKLCDEFPKDRLMLETIFPELKGGKDERIRKRLLKIANVWKEGGYACGNSDEIDDIIAWLEKQGKHLENFDKAEKEKSDFVGDGFIKCYVDFLDFKEGETYWLEYIGNDKYNVRSDNLLGKTYHITPCQLYTIFKKQTWLEKQGQTTKNDN